MTTTPRSSAGIAYERAGRTGDGPVVLIHAGIADRRMWDLLWPAFTAERDVIRLDLRGFGESCGAPVRRFLPVRRLRAPEMLSELGIGRCHLVGASLGAGVAVEVALSRPEQVRLLAAHRAGRITHRRDHA